MTNEDHSFRVKLEAGSATDEMYSQLHDKLNMRMNLDHIGKIVRAGAKKLREFTSNAVSAAAERLNKLEGDVETSKAEPLNTLRCRLKRQSRCYSKSDVPYPRGR